MPDRPKTETLPVSPDTCSPPKRIQRQRTKGWLMPKGAVYVGRPTKWGNPYKITDFAGRPCIIGPPRQAGYFLDDPDIKALRGWAVDLYRNWYAERTASRLPLPDLEPLRGHDLCCWCALVDRDGNHVPCHADVLLELAND